MHETFEFKNARINFKTRFAALILFKGMQLTDVKKSACPQNFVCLSKYKIYIFDVLIWCFVIFSFSSRRFPYLF